MKIEFFTTIDGSANVRFPGDAFASNEVILGVFYDNLMEDQAKSLFEDVEKVKKGELSVSKQESYGFGDYIDGTLNADYCTLENIHDLIKSKKYRVRTSSLVNALKKWLEFRKREDTPGLSELIEIDAEVIE